MDGDGRNRLAGIMARLRDGDEAAVFDLLARFGDPIRAAIAAIARERRCHHLGPDDLDDLAAEACFMLGRLARGWQPDGALPWSWARHRLVNLIDDWSGARTIPFDDHAPRSDRTAGALAYQGPEPEALDTLERLAVHDSRCALLLAALVEAVPTADREVLLRYAQQQAAGDPSPAHTVAADLGLSPPIVRQRACRARRRLRRVIEHDPRFAGLSGMTLIAAHQRGATAPGRGRDTSTRAA